MRLTTLVAGVILSCVLCTAALGKEPPTDWRKGGLPKDLDAEAIASLEKRKLLVGTKRFDQVFEPYVSSRLPVFVTSDSILAGYHVLFEESVVRLETARARALADALLVIWAGLPGAMADLELDEELERGAERRARTTLATALVLLDTEIADEHPEIAKLAAAEAKRIEAADGLHKPAWLGPPDPGFIAFDYARFRPRGFYDRNEALQRYFRAVSWLQVVPFRVDHDEEFLAHVLLARGLAEGAEATGWRRHHRAEQMLSGYAELLGRADEPTILDVGGSWSSPVGKDDLAGCRKRAANAFSGEPVLDRIAERADPALRVLPSARLPDAVLFQRTVEAAGGRTPPDVLTLCAALGSGWARTRVEQGGAGVLAAIDGAADELDDPEGLYGDYLQTIAALLDAPEPDAPPLFGGEPWAIKSCNTTLAGWTQLRHTWMLQAKQSEFYLGMARTEPGFVEPDPTFFARLGRLGTRTRTLLEGSGAFSERLALDELAADLRLATRVLGRLEPGAEPDSAFKKGLTDAERRALQVTEVLPYALSTAVPDFEDPDRWAKLKKLADDSAARLEDRDTRPGERLVEFATEASFNPELYWRVFTETCTRLEILAHKQLRGVAFDESERRFLDEYGATLAGLMLYGGNSYLSPKDDAPRVADVFFDPARKRRLHVGTARPRAFYLLYPINGRDVLCRGAVVPFHAFEHDSPLSDADWKTLLDSPDRPGVPDWAAPLYR